MAKNIKAVVLAAGKGTRMKSDTPKVLHALGGRPIIEYVIKAVRSSGIKEIVCVIGHKADNVKHFLKGTKVVKQKRLLGSADALKSAAKALKSFTGDILVLCGDIPLVTPETLKRLREEHAGEENSCTLLSAQMLNSTGYGRVVRDSMDRVIKIVEETEANPSEKSIKEINTGIYCFKKRDLFPLLNRIKNINKKSEYFLTDIISLMHTSGLKIGSLVINKGIETLGINSRIDLAIAEKELKMRRLAALMAEGVTIVDPSSTYIDGDVNIGRDTTIYPQTMIEGRVKIGRNCKIGPFARIRPGCELKDGVEIGTFVEIVRTKIDKRSKVKHHTYLGDCVVGKDVNVGAGTITANYDGKKKFVTTIDDNAFIGSGTVFVAPVKVGKKAVTGAGAVVTRKHNVAPGSVVVGIPAKVLKRGGRG